MTAAATGTNAAQNVQIGAGAGTITGDLWIIQLSHNDWKAQGDATYPTPTSVFRTELQALIDNFVARGACVLLVGGPKSNVAAPDPETETVEAYWSALKALANVNDHVACLEINEHWGTFAQGKALGLQSDASGSHPLQKGHADMAGIVYRALTASPTV
jgi:hypothetical protein